MAEPTKAPKAPKASVADPSVSPVEDAKNGNKVVLQSGLVYTQN